MPSEERASEGEASEQRFRATLYRLGPNYCVDVPARVSAALGGGRRVEVVGRARRAGGAARSSRAFSGPGGEAPAGEGRVRSALVPRGGGLHRLFVDGAARAAAGVGPGDRVALVIGRDAEPREPAVPPELARALDAVAGGREAFAAIPAASRASMLAFLVQARGAETRARRIERIVEHVRERVARRRARAPARPATRPQRRRR